MDAVLNINVSCRHRNFQVFPAFTYDARTGNLVDETPVTRQAFSGMLAGVAWGIAVAIFVDPLGIGVVSRRAAGTICRPGVLLKHSKGSSQQGYLPLLFLERTQRVGSLV